MRTLTTMTALVALFAATQAQAADVDSQFDMSYFDGAWQCEKVSGGAEGGPTSQTVVFKPNVIGSYGAMHFVSFGGEKQVNGGFIYGYDASTNQLFKQGAVSCGAYGYAKSDGWKGDTLAWAGKLWNFHGHEVSMTKTITKKSDGTHTINWQVTGDDGVEAEGSALCHR